LPMGPAARFNVKKQMEECSETPFSCVGFRWSPTPSPPPATDHTFTTRHIFGKREPAGGWHGTATASAYVTPKETLGLAQPPKTCGGGPDTPIKDSPAHAVPTSPATAHGARDRDVNETQPRPLRSSTEQAVRSLAHPERAPRNTTPKTLPADIVTKKPNSAFNVPGPKHGPMQTKNHRMKDLAGIGRTCLKAQGAGPKQLRLV